MDISFIGEHLLPGQTGHFLIILAFVASLLSCVCFFFAAQKSIKTSINNDQRDNQEISIWSKTGIVSFYIQVLSLFGVIACLFYIIYNQYFEYHYAWSHSSKQLPVHYMISCFWEGQEGSFLLWGIWQAVLGFLFINLNKTWRNPVLAIVSLSQVFISAMLMGIYFAGFKIGSNPFMLLRDTMPEAPIFNNPNYLSFIEDGRGLNPLLQNYWMVIHPPTLFLGFASTIIPFAFAIAGLWKKQYTEWIKPALPWTLFSVLVLGTGIIMGGAWAYESLTFGGFWAWDPVENASIIPWITIVGAAHVMVISKNTQQAIATTFILTLITFILVLYASFLTRSGILGDSSVHSFTDLGLGGQLTMFMFVFILIGGFLFIKNKKNFPKIKEEEKTYSREFWMFIGVLVLCISAFQITFSTSIPVFNKLLGTNLAPPVNAIEHYNSWQLPIAIVLCILTAITQFFKYKDTPLKPMIKKISIPLILAIILSTVIIFAIDIRYFHYSFLLFAGFLTILSNLDYLILVLKGKIKLSGASVAHIGFGLMVAGALISQSKQEIISDSNSKELEKLNFDKEKSKENILLLKNEARYIKDYRVVYSGAYTEGPNTFYKVNYEKINKTTGEVSETFTLLPNAQVNPQMGLISNPDTRHYITKDIYTHVTSVPNNDNGSDYKEVGNYNLAIGDTFFYKEHRIILMGLNKKPNIKNLTLSDEDIAVGAKLNISYGKEVFFTEPVYLIQNKTEFNIESEVESIDLKFRFTKILPETGKIEIKILTKDKDYIVMKAIIFPYINILWLGTVIMIIGFVIAIRRRISENKST